MVERLQVKACSIGRILTNLEKKYNNTYGEDPMKKSPSGQQLGAQPPNKRANLRIQQIPPFNANKIRKSPSSDPTTTAQIPEEESSEAAKGDPEKNED
jgi:hypothetical protein